MHLGFFVQDAHCNSRGGLHGGVIATLSDNAMGMSLAHALVSRGSKAESILTASLALDYVGSAAKGNWVEIAPTVVQSGTRSGVVTALVHADGRIVARANASFRFRTTGSPRREPE